MSARKKLLVKIAVLGMSIFGILVFGAYMMRLLAYPYNLVRPLLLDGGGKQCLDSLDKMGVEYKKLGDMRDGSCFIKNGVKIRHFPSTYLSSSITLSCPTAQRLGAFLDEIGAQNVSHLGSYNCRRQRGNSIVSEHGYGLAIDISEIDGASVLDDWTSNDSNGKILKKAHLTACEYFSNVLTPDSNTAHRNHFHFDNGLGFGCLSLKVD